MEKKPVQSYSNLVNNLIHLLKFKNYTPLLLGSSSDKAQIFYSDFDFFCPINKKYSMKDIMLTILHILKNINDNHDFYFTELKIQLKDGTKIKYNHNEKIDFPELDNIDIENLDFIKIDFVTRENNKFIEVSCIYKFDENINEQDETTKRELYEIIKQDYKEHIKDKDYFKALKREYSMTNLKTPNTSTLNRNEQLLKLFNGKYGEMYKIMNNLKALELLKKNHYNDKLTTQKIRLNLKELNLPYNTYDNLPKYINDIYKEINDKAKEYI